MENNNRSSDDKKQPNNAGTAQSNKDSARQHVGKSVAVIQNTASEKKPKQNRICWLKTKANSIPLSTRLVACTLAVLTVAAFCISLSIRQLVGNYLLEKTDAQLTDQARLI